MPEIKFYITDEERKELYEFITENDGEMIPADRYKQPEYVTIKNSDELIDCIYNRVVGFYILSPSFQCEPLVFREINIRGEDLFYIPNRTGGPYIDISFYRGFADDAAIKYKSTLMFHYARYMHYDSEEYEEFKVSDELKEYYAMIMKYLKTKCRRLTAKNGKKYWVSKTLKEEDVL